MPRKNTENTLFKTPDGVVDVAQVASVTPTDNGVAMANANRELLCWIEIPDVTMRKKVSRLIGERVFDARTGAGIVQVDWAEYGLDGGE